MEPETTYDFKDSETQNVSKTLLIGVAGTTGAGKTESAMRLARGIVGPHGTFAVIDTENKRALNKKSRYRFHHLDMQPPYTPQNFWGAIQAAIQAGHKAVVVDSFSAEWDGEGGLHDQATDILERITKGDPDKAQAMMGLSWKQPKMDHKRLMAYLRKCDVPIIFGLRAEPKIKYVKDDKGKTQVVDAGWLPIAEKLFGYDMLVYALMMAENPGVPVHLKQLEPEFEAMFPHGKQITEQCGEQLAKWAAGGQVKPTFTPAPFSQPVPARTENAPSQETLILSYRSQFKGAATVSELSEYGNAMEADPDLVIANRKVLRDEFKVRMSEMGKRK